MPKSTIKSNHSGNDPINEISEQYPKKTLILNNESATESLAQKFSKALLGEKIQEDKQKTWVIFLKGDLAAGKTTFVRGFLRATGYKGAVKSPTYTLVEPYESDEFFKEPIYHFDLYRLSDPEELEFIGIREYFTQQAIVLIEWPERGIGFLPEPDLELSFNTIPEGRKLDIHFLSSDAQNLNLQL